MSRLAGIRRRGLRFVERPREGGATLYYGYFGERAEKAMAPPPDFSQFEGSNDQRADRRALILSIIAHILILIAVMWTWTSTEEPERPKRQSGLDVTLVDVVGASRAQKRSPSAQLASASGLDSPTRRDASAPAEIKVPAEATAAGVVAANQTIALAPEPASPRTPVETTGEAVVTSAPVTGGPGARSPDEDRLEGAIVARIERKKRYPAAAMRTGQSDTIMLRLTIDRQGRLLLAELAKSKGIEVLDKEVLDLAKRASPYPVPPASVLGDAIRLLVPVEFVMKKRS